MITKPIPSEWVESELSNLFIHVIGGDWGKTIDYEDNEFTNVMCIRGTEFRHWSKEKGISAVPRKVKLTSLKNRKLIEDDILIEISGGGPDQPVGRTVLIDHSALKNHGSQDIVCTNFLRLARPNDKVNSSFLNSFLQQFYLSGEVRKYQGGSNNLRNLKFKEYETILIPLPPLAEQKQIATQLDDYLAQVESIKTRLDAIPNILKRFRKSVLAAAISGRLTKEWRKVNPSKTISSNHLYEILENSWINAKEQEFQRKGKQPKNDDWKNKYIPPTIDCFDKTPECWFLVSLKYLADVVDPNPSHRMPKYVSYGTPFISSENINKEGNIDFVKGKKITDDELLKQKQRYEVKDGVFAFTRIGTIGKSVFLPNPHNYGVSHAMAIVSPFNNIVIPSYLKITMSSENILNQALGGVQSVGVPDLGVGKMRSFKIPLPPFDEQTEIVNQVEKLLAFADQIEQRLASAQSHVNNLTQSILAKAFRGELTAKWREQNPDLISDENSAQALLDKIKAEMEKLKPAKRTRKKKTA